jgi:hypothetical protein
MTETNLFKGSDIKKSYFITKDNIEKDALE